MYTYSLPNTNAMSQSQQTKESMPESLPFQEIILRCSYVIMTLDSHSHGTVIVHFVIDSVSPFLNVYTEKGT
jgi:hypothetical protein